MKIPYYSKTMKAAIMDGRLKLGQVRDYQFRVRVLAVTLGPPPSARLSYELLDKEGLVLVNLGSGDVQVGCTLTLAEAQRAFEVTITPP
jgi:hypothetical protein